MIHFFFLIILPVPRKFVSICDGPLSKWRKVRSAQNELVIAHYTLSDDNANNPTEKPVR